MNDECQEVRQEEQVRRVGELALCQRFVPPLGMSPARLTEMRAPSPTHDPRADNQNSTKPLPLPDISGSHEVEHSTYRYGSMMPDRSMPVLREKMRVVTTDRNVMNTKQKKDAWIGRVVKTRYTASAA